MSSGLLSPPAAATGSRRHRTVPLAAVLTAAAFLVAPPLGRDLAAQVARAEFWSRHGPAVWDLGWYGGFSPYGYSLLTPAPMAWLGGGTDGPRRLGALALVVTAVAFAALLRRTDARRPVLGGLLGLAGIAGNLVSGRITFTVGLAFGVGALLAAAYRRPVVAVAAAVLTSAASPVAGLFLGLGGTALILCGRRRGGIGLAAGSGVPLLATGLVFGTDGPMTTLAADT